MKSANHQPTKLGYSIREACQVTSLGRTTLYALIAAGRLRVTRLGGCQSARKKDPLSASKRDPFAEQRDRYDGRSIRAGCGVGRA